MSILRAPFLQNTSGRLLLSMTLFFDIKARIYFILFRVRNISKILEIKKLLKYNVKKKIYFS